LTQIEQPNGNAPLAAVHTPREFGVYVVRPAAARAVTYSLTPSPTTVAAGGMLSVSFTAPPGSAAQDWVALLKVGDPSTGYMNRLRQFTNGATSGTFAFTAPPTGGQYEFRYLLDNGYSDVARSAPITVTGGTATPYTLTAGSTSLAAGAPL